MIFIVKISLPATQALADRLTVTAAQCVTYIFVEYVVVVGDIVAEQVRLCSDDERVCVGAGRQPAGSEAANHLVDVE